MLLTCKRPRKRQQQDVPHKAFQICNNSSSSSSLSVTACCPSAGEPVNCLVDGLVDSSTPGGLFFS
jgi:hypothetical protein